MVLLRMLALGRLLKVFGFVAEDRDRCARRCVGIDSVCSLLEVS
jgi:hypothetical protein